MQNKSSARMDCSSKKQDASLAALAIGNSFSASAFFHLPELVRAIPGCGYEFRYECVNIGGCSLESHCEENDRAERDRAYVPPYCFANGKRTLREFLEADRWDVVDAVSGVLRRCREWRVFRSARSGARNERRRVCVRWCGTHAIVVADFLWRGRARELWAVVRVCSRDIRG